MSSRLSALRLYKELIRESSKFASYNFREYTKRRVKYEFRKHASDSDSVHVNQLLAKGNEDLALIKRQVLISQLYPAEKSVVEGKTA